MVSDLMYPAKEAISSRNNIPLIGSVLIYRGRIRNSRRAPPARTHLHVILVKRNKFCQRLVACEEGPFTTVCIIMRPAKQSVQKLV